MIVTAEDVRALRVSLRGGLVIVLQQTAEPLTTRDAPVARRRSDSGEDQPVAHALVVALEVIKRDELVNRAPERPFPDRIRRSKQDSLTFRTKRSAYALRFGERGRRRTT
jgi:hypothetical protein